MQKEKTIWQFLIKMYTCTKSIHFTQNSQSRCIYPREMNAYIYTKTRTQILQAALFIIARMETPQYPPAGKWISR